MRSVTATWQTASRLDAAKASSSASCVAFARAAPESETSETVTCANAAASAPMASTATAATVTFGACVQIKSSTRLQCARMRMF